jgi:rRNA maturation RNase YbeY
VASRLSLRNRQRTRRLNLGLLRRIARALLEEFLPRKQFELGLILTGATEMARLNESYLRHAGPTDVIAFDYSNAKQRDWIDGEIFICVDEALVQARRFHTTWQGEVVRYLVHGVLHLCGYDDKSSARRRTMKAVENRLVRRLASRFPVHRLAVNK